MPNAPHPDLRHHTAVIGGLKMHWVEAGSGAPVVLLHGFPETGIAGVIRYLPSPHVTA